MCQVSPKFVRIKATDATEIVVPTTSISSIVYTKEGDPINVFFKKDTVVSGHNRVFICFEISEEEYIRLIKALTV